MPTEQEKGMTAPRTPLIAITLLVIALFGLAIVATTAGDHGQTVNRAAKADRIETAQ